MPKLTVLVGPPGSGKTTYALLQCQGSDLAEDGKLYINQDSQGKEGHLKQFQLALDLKADIYVDRLNFSKGQRDRYLAPARAAGYETEIIVLHENRETCLKRCLARLAHHETITTEENAHSALNMFFAKYERPTPDEADTITFVYPEHKLNLTACIIDIDGTAANIDHRLHFVRKEEGKRADWQSFFKNMHLDEPNTWCRDIVNSMREKNAIVYCSGRPDNFRKETTTWLQENKFLTMHDYLLMRPRNDSRDDRIIKEIIFDFEIMTRFKNIKFAIDDRQRVVDMWRSRGVTTLQCAEGNF